MLASHVIQGDRPIFIYQSGHTRYPGLGLGGVLLAWGCDLAIYCSWGSGQVTRQMHSQSCDVIQAFRGVCLTSGLRNPHTPNQGFGDIP